MAAFPRDSWTDDLRRLPFGRAMLALFVATGGVMALSSAGVLPELALAVGVSALVATQLIDISLYNRLRLETRSAIWGLIVAFVYCQSVALALCYRRLRGLLSAGRDPDRDA